MMFEKELDQYSWEDLLSRINAKTGVDVERAIRHPHPEMEEFMALISPEAENYLEQIAQRSRAITLKRFGRTMRLYIPLYLSNECSNSCIYCGFNAKNEIERTTLTIDEIRAEYEAIKQMGFDSVLLVTGEHPKKAGVAYLKEAIELAKKYFSQVSLEVQPMSEEDYSALIESGLHAVYVYQETYHKANYNKYHLGGKKADFSYRLATPERLGNAGIHRVGLGVLLGLEDWRVDAFFTALHLRFLNKQFWKTKYSISFPRLRPHAGSFNPNDPISDKQLVLLMCAYRILDEDVEISLSTRESKFFRDHVFPLSVTAMSAGSSTEPGGYAKTKNALEQFTIDDNRSPEEMAQMLREKRYDPVWKDWDGTFAG